MEPGSLARLHGLGARYDLNGRVVRLCQYIASQDRWRCDTLHPPHEASLSISSVRLELLAPSADRADWIQGTSVPSARARLKKRRSCLIYWDFIQQGIMKAGTDAELEASHSVFSSLKDCEEELIGYERQVVQGDFVHQGRFDLLLLRLDALSLDGTNVIMRPCFRWMRKDLVDSTQRISHLAATASSSMLREVRTQLCALPRPQRRVFVRTRPLHVVVSVLPLLQQKGRLVADMDHDLEIKSECERDDDIFVLNAVQRSPLNIQYASSRLKAHKEIGIAAVQQHGAALSWLDRSLQSDPSVVHAAVFNDGDALEFADVTLRSRKDIVLTAVSSSWCGSALLYAASAMRRDKRVVLTALECARIDLEDVLNPADLAYDSAADKLLDRVLDSVAREMWTDTDVQSIILALSHWLAKRNNTEFSRWREDFRLAVSDAVEDAKGRTDTLLQTPRASTCNVPLPPQGLAEEDEDMRIGSGKKRWRRVLLDSDSDSDETPMSTALGQQPATPSAQRTAVGIAGGTRGARCRRNVFNQANPIIIDNSDDDEPAVTGPPEPAAAQVNDASSSNVVDVDSRQEWRVPSPPPAAEVVRIKQERLEATKKAIDVRWANLNRQDQEARVSVKQEMAAASIEVIGESVNLTDEWAAPSHFPVSDEQKPCPKCGHAVTMSRRTYESLLHCGNGHCRNPTCRAEFCWKCCQIFEDAHSARPTTRRREKPRKLGVGEDVRVSGKQDGASCVFTGHIIAAHADGTFDVVFTDGELMPKMPASRLKLDTSKQKESDRALRALGEGCGCGKQ